MAPLQFLGCSRARARQPIPPANRLIQWDLGTVMRLESASVRNAEDRALLPRSTKRARERERERERERDEIDSLLARTEDVFHVRCCNICRLRRCYYMSLSRVHPRLCVVPRSSSPSFVRGARRSFPLLSVALTWFSRGAVRFVRDAIRCRGKRITIPR